MDIQPEKCKFQNEEVNALIVAKLHAVERESFGGQHMFM